MMAFENIEVCMPNNYDAYLTRVYGDYMTPPPIEKRQVIMPDILLISIGD